MLIDTGIFVCVYIQHISLYTHITEEHIYIYKYRDIYVHYVTDTR